MAVRISAFVLGFLSFCAAPHIRAESGGVNSEATEMAGELIGAPVFAKDGIEVGEVADIAFDDKLDPQRLRIGAAATLGLGTKILDVPKDNFMALRGAVILDVPSEAVAAFPEVTERAAGK